ncbi:MAG: OmpH family outer membrane protein [Bacteroidota bacterium]
MMRNAFLLGVLVALAAPASAQQKLGYIDSEAILNQMPEFQSVQQEIDRLVTQWEGEVAALRTEADQMADAFAAREILFTDDERERQRAALRAKRQEHDALRRRYFGPEGELFREQQTRLRPVQERLLAAVEAVAQDGEYDYVFDRSGDYVFLYTRPRHNLTDLVLDELGVRVGVGSSAGR